MRRKLIGVEVNLQSAARTNGLEEYANWDVDGEVNVAPAAFEVESVLGHVNRVPVVPPNERPTGLG